MKTSNNRVGFIWKIAELLRGPYLPAQYGKVILPLTVLRRLDCVLEPTKEKVLAKYKELEGGRVKNIEPILNRVTGHSFHNTSRFDFKSFLDDPDNIAANLSHYIKSFSSKARDIFEYFGFEEHIAKLDNANRLFLIVSEFCKIDLHPDVVPNIEMGYIFEELIRRFNEAAKQTAGDHFTPREVIRLMVNLLFEPDTDILTTKGIVKTLFDPACGTGGMLSVAEEYLRELNPDARLEVFGQDYNGEAYAICGSDMLIKGQNPENIVFGDSFTEDGHPDERFDYSLANPPFGVEWKPQKDFIQNEYETKGYDGRFGAGLPSISDGSLLFLQHMISKMDPAGSRIGIVFNGSPLFTGDAGSGPSNIRRWIIENDWLEAIIALPDQLFYNTGITTYIWIVTNNKRPERHGKIQLISAVGFYEKMRKSLGNKRNEISDEQTAEVTCIYGDFAENEYCKIFDNEYFGYRKMTIERPLRLNFEASAERIDRLKGEKAFESLAESKKKKEEAKKLEEAEGRREQQRILDMLATLPDKLYVDRDEFERDLKRAAEEAGVKLSVPIKKAILAALSERDETAEICRDKNGDPEPDKGLRDTENVPLGEDVYEYFEREVLPHVPDAWINEDKKCRDEIDGEVGRVGYEINFNRYFYKYEPPRPLEEIEADIERVEREIVRMLGEITG